MLELVARAWIPVERSFVLRQGTDLDHSNAGKLPQPPQVEWRAHLRQSTTLAGYAHSHTDLDQQIWEGALVLPWQFFRHSF